MRLPAAKSNRIGPETTSAVCSILLLLTGCGPASEQDRLENVGPLTGPFYVSEHFSPSGHMGDGEEPEHITVDIDENCKERPPGAGGACYRFTYQPGSYLWSGVYWVHPANNWGSRPGRDVDFKFNTVRFYAATDADALNVQFIAGGIYDPAQTYHDEFKVSSAEEVGREYKQFRLDLSTRDIKSVIGAFCWVTNYPPDTDPATAEPIVIYLDDIAWE